MKNWYTVGLLAWIVEPSRIPPRRGLAGTWVGRRSVTFRMRDRSNIRCRLQDATGIVSVYVNQEYDLPWIKWGPLSSIIDIGAHVGAFTIWAAQRCPWARIVAVEPSPAVYGYLHENVYRNGLVGRVRTVKAALGAEVGEAYLEPCEISARTRVVSTCGDQRSKVRVTTLAELLMDVGVDGVDLLKVDCEGGEYDILLNAPDSILQRIKTVVCEYHPVPGNSPVELRHRLTSVGFKVAGDSTPQGILWADRPEP